MRLNVGKMLTCLAKISLPACGRRCVLELRNAVLGGQSGVQAVLRALRRFSSDFRAFLVVFPRFSPDIGCRRAGSLVRGHRGRLPAAEMLETCWTLIALLNVASTVPTLWEILSSRRAALSQSHVRVVALFCCADETRPVLTTTTHSADAGSSPRRRRYQITRYAHYF